MYLGNLGCLKSGKLVYIKQAQSVKIVLRCGYEHGYLGSKMDAIILNIFEINYSQLIQYEILEKLVTYIMHFACSF